MFIPSRAVLSRVVLFAVSALLGASPAAVAVAANANPPMLETQGVSTRAERQATAAIDAAWREGAALWGEPDDGRSPTVTLHAEYESYSAIDKKLSGGRFERNWAFAWSNPPQAHVVIQPPVSDGALRVAGLPLQTARLLAHETAHLVRYGACPNSASHPHWLADGYAQLIAWRALRSLDLVPEDMADDPEFASNILRTQQALHSDTLPTVVELLDDAEGELGFTSRYAARLQLVRWFESLGMLESLAIEARRLGGGSALPANLKAWVLDQLAQHGVDDPDTAFAVWMEDQPARWDVVFGALDATDDMWTQIAFPTTNAIAWRAGDAAEHGKTYTLTGSVRVLPGEKQQMNLLLGRDDDDGFVSIAFGPSFGVTVFRYRSEGNQWDRIGGGPVGGFETGRWANFRVEVEGRTVRITLARSKPIEVTVDRELDGPWGVGAQAGAAGQWRSITAE